MPSKTPVINRFHVFADAYDVWFGDIIEALHHYSSLGDVSKRLYVEQYANEEALYNDEMDEEQCLLSHGGFPR